jgi:urease accessory protein
LGGIFVTAERKNGRTILTGVRFTAPLKIAKPFYREGRAEITLMRAGPGLLPGDRQSVSLKLLPGANLTVTTQSYQKIYKADGSGCESDLDVELGAGAELCYLPQPTIPFAGSLFDSNAKITLGESSKLFYCDIIGAGRESEPFGFAGYSSFLRVYANSRLVFLDGARLFPQEANVAGIGFFEGRRCQGLMYVYGYDFTGLPPAAGVEAAVSKAREGFVIRALSDSMADVFAFANNLRERIVSRGGASHSEAV